MPKQNKEIPRKSKELRKTRKNSQQASKRPRNPQTITKKYLKILTKSIEMSKSNRKYRII